MNSKRSILVMLTAMTFAAVIAVPSDAEAKRKGFLFLLVQWGDTLTDVGELPEPYNEAFPDKRAGFKCSVIGLFWAYFHWWDCEATVLEDEDTYYTDTPEDVKEAIAKEYSASDGLSFWNKHGRWIYLAALIGFGVMGAMGGKGESIDDDYEEDQGYPPAP